MKRQLRLGCIGAGMIMNVAHLPFYVELRKVVQVTAVMSGRKESAKALKEEYLRLMSDAGAEVNWEVAVCDTVDEMLPLIDVADIGTPTRWHAYYAEKALLAGVHVMSEKPIARNWLEAERLNSIAKQSKAKYQLNDDNVFLPRYQHIKNIVASGVIGEITNIVLPRGTPSSARNDWFFDPLSGGGAILDYGSHAVMGAWFLIGFDKIPRKVRSTGIRVKDRTRFIGGRLQEIETDDDAHFKVLFENPENGDFITAMLEATWAWPDFADNASDSHGYIRIDGTEGTVTSHFDENDKEFIIVKNMVSGERRIPIQSYRSETLSFRDEILNFISSIHQDKESMINAELGAQSMLVIGAAQLSELRDRRTVAMDEARDYFKQFDDGSEDMLAIGDAIALEIMQPYRLPDMKNA